MRFRIIKSNSLWNICMYMYFFVFYLVLYDKLNEDQSLDVVILKLF